MARDLEHLELRMWQRDLPRRRHGGGRSPERERGLHGQELLEQATAVAAHLEERIRTAPSGISPKLLFKLHLHPKADLSDEDLRKTGLRVLAREARHAIVVFPDEASLDEMRRRIREYAGLADAGHQYGYLAAINAVLELTPEDRKGVRLKEDPLADDEVASLDVELWHAGDRAECRRQIGEVGSLLRAHGLAVTDDYVGTYLCLVRARVDRRMLDMLLGIDYVKEIDRRPRPTFEVAEVVRVRRSNIHVETNLPEDLVGVVVIDSGVTQQHPVLRPCIADAQVFPDHLHERITGGAEDGDQATGGHGTSVAGIAAYNDIGECIARRVFEASALVFSARVTDDNNEYDENELIEHQLADAVGYFLRNYSAVRVFNISLGDARLVYSDGSYQFRLAAAIDELAYQYRDREVIFVVSAGNFAQDTAAEEVVARYPGYLLDTPSARVIDPATAGLALTVGGLSYGTGRDLQGYSERGTERVVAQDRGCPSCFTRTGWGVDGAIKPELVDFAGDQRFERGHLPLYPVYAGLPSTNKAFAPPEGQLFRFVAGTSFAAPRVANLAARLCREFPRASSNLIRALIADSARIPDVRPPRLTGPLATDDERLRIYGYGQPDFTRARWSAENECLLITDGTIAIDTFRLYEIPPLPEGFLTAKGKGYLSVTLAFDPPTRHTRGDSYLGVTMHFGLFRNVPPQGVGDALRVWSKQEKDEFGEEDLPSLKAIERGTSLPFRVEMRPGLRRRGKGTLQRGVSSVGGPSWQYNRDPLVLAVICQRKWAPADVVDQRFAVVVSVRHANPDVEIHAHMRQHVQVYERLRARV